MKILGIIVGAILILALMAGVGAGANIASLQWYKWFQPQVEDAKRDVFTHTRAYTESKKQQLAKYRFEYNRSSDTLEKKAICGAVRHEFAEIEQHLLGYDLENFYIKCTN